MNGYLVMARCWEDEVPVRFLTGHAEAARFARELTAERVVELANSPALDYGLLGVEEVEAAYVVEFAAGVPVGGSFVKQFATAGDPPDPFPLDDEDDGDEDGEGWR